MLQHDVHCLDSIRKALWFWLEDHWNSTHNPFTLYDSPFAAMEDRGDIFEIHHVDHCIDNIRQSIICNADTTPNVFQYSEEVGEIRARATVVHECRDFDLVIEWAKQHQTNPDFNFGTGPEVGKCAFEDDWTCLYS